MEVQDLQEEYFRELGMIRTALSDFPDRYVISAAEDLAALRLDVEGRVPWIGLYNYEQHLIAAAWSRICEYDRAREAARRISNMTLRTRAFLDIFVRTSMLPDLVEARLAAIKHSAQSLFSKMAKAKLWIEVFRISGDHDDLAKAKKIARELELLHPEDAPAILWEIAQTRGFSIPYKEDLHHALSSDRQFEGVDPLFIRQIASRIAESKRNWDNSLQN